MTIQWTSELELGIPVIDSQHRRIVDYINHVEHAQKNLDKHEIFEVLDELVDYTLSHFAFEENLMEEAGYPFSNPHKKVHRLFAKRVAAFQSRAKSGEDITEELLHVLKAWLVNHIKCDDKDYAKAVRTSMNKAAHQMKAQTKASWFNRLFG